MTKNELLKRILLYVKTHQDKNVPCNMQRYEPPEQFNDIDGTILDDSIREAVNKLRLLDGSIASNSYLNLRLTVKGVNFLYNVT
jgi:hypothetical protein